jgi:hypothetical protein
MKCWNSAFNAQGSRLIIVVVQVGAVKKIHVAAAAAVEALKRKETQDETQFTTRIESRLQTRETRDSSLSDSL